MLKDDAEKSGRFSEAKKSQDLTKTRLLSQDLMKNVKQKTCTLVVRFERQPIFNHSCEAYALIFDLKPKPLAPLDSTNSSKLTLASKTTSNKVKKNIFEDYSGAKIDTIEVANNGGNKNPRL